ncbi:GNAT family N-acetyltransferase [Flavobacterium litorale]|uniref:GNAT family N-acetyltransferase n=1 Tax=Flavobacterium litorale TaxID=2856519 RepID=A0ABX8V9U4_9FLAO|nr:GNAT family N-acetyltransferase [Flavobacterium litorale]QYJ67963.1 GNAT family N-acetyltransferase [Flavobacterium litorale]
MQPIHDTYTTKEGKTITVRNGITADAAKLLALKKKYLKDCNTIPLFDYEYKNTVAQEAELIAKYTAEENSLLLVAEYNGQLIGNIDITGNQREKLFHTAVLGMGIGTTWQNKGIGSCIMQSALKAMVNTPVTIVWLEVYASNNKGLRLYEKYGFETCGTIKNFFNETIPVDKITMVKYLE